jgi:hypothetical protein
MPISRFVLSCALAFAVGAPTLVADSGSSHALRLQLGKGKRSGNSKRRKKRKKRRRLPKDLGKPGREAKQGKQTGGPVNLRRRKGLATRDGARRHTVRSHGLRVALNGKRAATHETLSHSLLQVVAGPEHRLHAPAVMAQAIKDASGASLEEFHSMADAARRGEVVAEFMRPGARNFEINLVNTRTGKSIEIRSDFNDRTFDQIDRPGFNFRYDAQGNRQ